MGSFIRITLLGLCVAAGVAVAVGLAGHFANPESISSVELSGEKNRTTEPDPLTKQTWVDARPDDDDDDAAAEVAEHPDVAGDAIGLQSARSTAAPRYQPTPYYMHYQPPPISNQLNRLEEALQRVAEVSTQDQIRKLEEKIEQLAKSKRELVPAPAEGETKHGVVPRDGCEQVHVATNHQVKADAVVTPPRLDLPEIRRGEGGHRLTLNLRGQDLRQLLEFLSAEADLNVLASDSVKGSVTASVSDMDAESAILAILRITGFAAKKDGNLLYVGTTADLERMEQLDDKVKTRVYRTEYVTAAEMEVLIRPLLSSNGKMTVSSPSETSIPADTVQTGGDDFAGNEVVMVHDYETVLLRIDEIVAQIDQRPRQVMIEAMIVSVALDDSHSVGINFEAFQKSKSLRLVTGTPLANLGEISLSKGGFQFGVLDGNIAAFIDALEGIGDTNVIAAPHLLCLNKQRAEILIGDQKGYLSTTQTETATTQTVEFLDLGTQLRIRPFISADGMVRLEVHPELSTGDVKLKGAFALPEKTTTQVTTNIMCRDGCTVVIGGLIREDHARTVTQAAMIGNLPILGPLFRNKKVEDQRSEIIVMLTPKIVRDPAVCEEGADCLSGVSQRRAAVELRRISPVARQHYSRRYYRLAQSAWYAGNLAEAQRFLEISLQMQPHNLMAKRLFAIIMSGEGNAFHLYDGPEVMPYEIDESVEFGEPEVLPEMEPLSPPVPGILPLPIPDQARTDDPSCKPADQLTALTAVPIESPIQPVVARVPVVTRVPVAVRVKDEENQKRVPHRRGGAATP